MESSTSPDIKTSPDNGDELKKSTGDQTKLPSSPFRKLAGFVTRTPPRERRNVAKTRYAIEVKGKKKMFLHLYELKNNYYF